MRDSEQLLVVEAKHHSPTTQLPQCKEVGLSNINSKSRAVLLILKAGQLGAGEYVLIPLQSSDPKIAPRQPENHYMQGESGLVAAEHRNDTWTGIVGEVQQPGKAVKAVAHSYVDGLSEDAISPL